MNPNPFLGVFFHAVGGIGAGSFYTLFRNVRGWAWETYWLVGGLVTWLVAPWIVAAVTVPDLAALLGEVPLKNLAWIYLFGLGWGIGNLTFGLSLRYLGLSLGYAISLGCCAVFGTLIPPLYEGSLVGMLHTLSGRITLSGVGICALGIMLCGAAGISKEHELSDEQKRAGVREFHFLKGLCVAIFAGIMSACMAFGVSAGGTVADLAVRHRTPELWKNGPPFLFIFAGCATTNVLWCLFLNRRNRTGGDYTNAGGAPLLNNYVFCALAGAVGYLEYMFYGMGASQMGKYDFSSFSIHLAFVIIFSNVWGVLFGEWRGTRRRTVALLVAGLIVLLGSSLISGYGNDLKAREQAAMPLT